MKKVYRKYGIALALLMVFALLKVTLVPNLQHTALYRPLKDGITTLGWVLVIYMGFWYLERRRWEKATPEERRPIPAGTGPCTCCGELSLSPCFWAAAFPPPWCRCSSCCTVSF